MSSSAILDARLHYLYTRLGLGTIKLDLDTTRHILEVLGGPERSYASIHVAGTNGKGSVCAMLDSILRAAGFRVGLYTSPHLMRFNERIRVQGEEINNDALLELINLVEQADHQQATGGERRLATFFEFTTAMAFEHFRRSRVQVAVLEAGMGGRLDATNVVTPLLTIITHLALEHTRYLGDTLEAIAREKAGIIKTGRPLVTCRQAPEAQEVLGITAGLKTAPLVVADDSINVRRTSQGVKGQRIKIETGSTSLGPLTLPLLGDHQLQNCALAVAAVECIRETWRWPVSDEAIVQGLENVRWAGRCQVLQEVPLTLLDVAHNPDGAASLARTIKALQRKRPVALVAGILEDKDAAGFFKQLAPVVAECILVPVSSERAMPMDRQMAAVRQAGLQPREGRLPEALREAQAWARENGGMVCIAGSLYLAGEVLHYAPRTAHAKEQA